MVKKLYIIFIGIIVFHSFFVNYQTSGGKETCDSMFIVFSASLVIKWLSVFCGEPGMAEDWYYGMAEG